MYYIIQHQYDPAEEAFRPYAMDIVDKSFFNGKRFVHITGYETLEEAKKVLEKVQNTYEIEIQAENEYEEKLALAKGEDYKGQSHAMKYSIYSMKEIK